MGQGRETAAAPWTEEAGPLPNRGSSGGVGAGPGGGSRFYPRSRRGATSVSSSGPQAAREVGTPSPLQPTSGQALAL